MKKTSFIVSVAIMALFAFFKPSDNTVWTTDKDHSRLGFTISHLMVSDVDGFFKTFEAKVTASGKDFTNAVVVLTADVNSIDTESEARDKHLKSPDFFDAEKYPVITFKSKSFKKVSDTNYKIAGDLTMHGVTKPVELDAVCRMGTNPMNKKEIAGFKITGKLKRTDFGIGASTPDAMVGDEVSIIANTQLNKD